MLMGLMPARANPGGQHPAAQVDAPRVIVRNARRGEAASLIRESVKVISRCFNVVHQRPSSV
jgi:hypothetical protein